MAWSGSEKFIPKGFLEKIEKEKKTKQVSSFYDDSQTKRAENSKSIGEKNPVAKAVSKSKTTSGSKKNVATSHTEPKSDLKFSGGYQSTYEERKQNGRVFTPSTVLGRKMSERTVDPNTVLGRYANGFFDEGTVNAKRRRYSKVDPATGKQIVISDYVPGSHSMTKAEYNRRRAVNPSMPEFGSYEYFADAERALRPMMEEIANDDDRMAEQYREWAYNYEKYADFLQDNPAWKQKVEKILYQDRVIAEYKEIHEMLSGFETDITHYRETDRIENRAGQYEMEYVQKRLGIIGMADKLPAITYSDAFQKQSGNESDISNGMHAKYIEQEERANENFDVISENAKIKYYDTAYNDRVAGYYEHTNDLDFESYLNDIYESDKKKYGYSGPIVQNSGRRNELESSTNEIVLNRIENTLNSIELSEDGKFTYYYYRPTTKYEDENGSYEVPGWTTEFSVSASSLDDVKLMYLTAEERAIYALMLDKDGIGEAEKFIRDIGPILDKRYYEAKSACESQWANEHKIWGTIEGIGKSIVGKPLALVDNVKQAIEQNNATSPEGYLPYNEYSDTNRFLHRGRALKEGASRDMSDTGKFFYNVGTGIPESAIYLPLGPYGAPIAVGISTAGETAVDRGLKGETNAADALATGVAMGTIEALTEKLPLDNLFKVLDAPPSTIKAAVVTILKNAGVEGTEEAIATMAGNITDAIINGDTSDYEVRKQYLIEMGGCTEEEAEQKAFFEFYLKDPLINAAAGAISGIVMNTSATTTGYVNNTIETGRTINEQGQAQDVVDAGLGYDNATQANEYAQKMQTKQKGGGTLSNWNVGRQFQKNVQAFHAEKNLVKSVKEGLGVDVELSSKLANEDGKTLNGRYDGNNRIDISKNGTTSVPATLGHEVLHFMQNNAPQAYQAMHKYVSDMINSGENNGFKERFDYHKNVNGYNDYVATEEIVAELAESMFGKKSSIDSMVKNNPKMVQTVLDGIKSTKAKIKDKFLAPNTNRTGLKTTYAQLDKFEQMYNNALREASQNKGNVVSGEPRTAERNSYAGIESRLEGDNLLDAYDMIETIKSVGGTVDENGYVKVFHNTSRDSVNNIRNTGKMSAKEDGVFFSTKADGQASGYGDETIELNVPVEMLVLDDIFDDEAHFRIPLKSKNDTLDVSKYLAETSNSAIRYSLSKNARKDVHDALNNKNFQDDVRLTDTTPSIMLSQKGVKNLPMLMNPSHLRENVFTEEEARARGLKVNKGINYHGLGEDLFLKVIEDLDAVTVAYRGTKNAENSARRENYFLLISEQTDKDGNIINVPVFINETGRYNRVFIDTNKIATVFGRSDLNEYIKRQINDKNLVRIKNKSTQTSESTSPIDAHYGMNASTDIIFNPDKNVKTSGRNSYAGDHAKTANFEELQGAMAMDEKGIDAKFIWQETGWGKGQDGLWRFEIDNSEAEYIGPETGNSTHKLSEVLKHDKLYEAYPELKDLPVIHMNDMGGGQYSPGSRWIFIDSQMSNEEKRKVLLHEVQHAIQEIENFAVGEDFDESGAEKYWRSAGELEARDVSDRADMTAEERRNTFPESMEKYEGLEVIQWHDHPYYKILQERKARNEAEKERQRQKKRERYQQKKLENAQNENGMKMDDAGVRYSVAEGTGNVYTPNKAAQQKVQDLMREQGVSSPSELSPDTVTREQSKKDRNIFRGRQGIRNFMSRAYTLVVDDMHPFWNYNKAYEKVSSQTNYGKDNPYKLAINAKDASSRAAYIVSDKMVDFDNEEVNEGLVTVISDSGITEKNYNDFNNYLVARHALEWLDPDEHGPFKNVYENPALNDVDVVSAMIEDFESKNPEFEIAAENLYNWQRQLMQTWLVDTGVITQEQYDRFTEMYPDYVPFFREQNVHMSRNASGGFANQGNLFKQAVGTQERRILQPIENIMYNVASYVNHATKHAVTSSAVRLYDMLESDPENNVLRQYWEEVEPVNPDDKKPQYFRAKDSETADIQDVTQEEENSISQTLKEQMGVQDGVVTIIDNGRRRYFRVNDADFLTVLDNIKPGKLDGVFGLMASFARTRAALITSWNPAFSLASNPMRDFGTLITNSSDANKAKVIKEAVSSYVDVAKSSEAYKQYLSMGGQYSSVTTEGMDAMKIAMQKLKAKDPNMAKRFFKLFPKMFNGYQTISDAIESAPRMSEFKTTLDKGHDFHEAFFRAKDVTTNFIRGGKIAKELNAASNFFNASIQGVDKFFRQAKNNPKSFAVGVSCLAAIELLAWAWNTAGDDEEKEEAYDNLSNYTKNNNYNFYIGGGEFISIPKARESAVLGTSISATLDTLVNEQDDRFKDFFSDYVLSQFIPDGSIIGLSTRQDLRANQDYLGRPIVSAELEKLPDELQYDDDTSYLAKWLGGVIKQSPKQIDHIINSEAGVLGKINRTYFSPSGQQDKATMLTFGVNTTFNKDSLLSTDHPTFFYNNKEEADKQANGYPSADNGYLSNRYYQAGNVMGIMNEIYKEDAESEAGREMRRAYVNYAKEYKKNPMGLSDDVYNEIKDLYDADAKALSMPTIQRELKLKIGKEEKSFVFSDAESLINYQKDVNKGVDEAYRKLLSDVCYNAMSDLEKAEALNNARADATKAVKKFYIENEGKMRMYTDDGATNIVKPSKDAIEQYKQKTAYQQEVMGYLQTIADNVANAVPDKANDYSVSSMQINDIQSAKIDGKSYKISGDVERKVIDTANDVHYSNVEKLMNNEINVEDVVGYTATGRARTSTQADGTKVQLTGKLYNDDGTPRFDEVVMARIMYQSKEAAKDYAIEQHKGEITGNEVPTFTPTPTSNTTSSTKVSSSSGGRKKITSAKVSSGSSTTATTKTGNKVRFTGRAGTTPTRSTQIVSIHLPNVVTPKAVNTDIMQQAVNAFMKNAEIKPIQPLKNPLTM